ncbi:tgf-beta family [Holotrichia oblita]|uniref:Tgf-beta family n=1 Tax=Holotrichia oblita TaxID=644536 RepID=A0ACB9SXU3_HOLOL|nr:tgf-beta family [Holotrichia oblita]
MIVSTTESSENDDDSKSEKTIEVDVDKIKINGKTYFFQLRKGEQGNETTYKKIRNYKNEGFDEQFGVDIVVEEEIPKEKFSPFESLKSRRRDFMKSERTRHLQNVHLLDSEWKYNTNNQYLEIPDIAGELYRAMKEEYQGMRDVSTIRILFETLPDEEDILKFNLDCIRNKSEEIVVDAELLVFRYEIKHELKKSNIHITFIPTNNRHLFTNLKTPIKHDNQSNVVYKLDCKDCNKCYIGQTKQYLKKRIYNHQYTVTHNVTAETALSKHSKDRRHNFDFQNIKILKKENNYKKRLIYEMIYIKKDENAVFKVENIVQNWLNGEENLGFLLSATDSWENTVALNIGRKYHGKIQPMLILYINKQNQRVTSTANLPRPNRKHMERYLSFSKNTNTLPTHPTGCSKYVWYVSFQEMGWNNFILAPSGFMSFRCKGSCFTPIISPFTNHALLKFMYQETYTYLRKPCCVPDTMKPLTIMYIDNKQNVVIKMYEDMIVDGCGCR